MPVNKDALFRYRIIDRLLSDPNRTYNTDEILTKVNLEAITEVTKRMIQKDIKALEEDFGKEMVRGENGRGTVRYADQSEPLFYQQLTDDEEEIIRQALKTLGQFEGMESLTRLDLLKKRIDQKTEKHERPLISFGTDGILQIPDTLIGKLFWAISNKKTIRIKYTPFGKATREYDIYPYQLRQFNNRWFLIANMVATEVYPYREYFIANFPLDRMSADVEYLDDEPYIEIGIDLQTRFDEIVGVTLDLTKEVECIYYAVSPNYLNYIRTKMLHPTQMEVEGDELADFRANYPEFSLWGFFSIECRPNEELYALLASHCQDLVVLEPSNIRSEIAARLKKAAGFYNV